MSDTLSTKTAKRKKDFLLQDTIISLIVVTENDEKIIEEALRNVNTNLKQFKTHYEILVVDNNSNDKTIEKVKHANHTITHIRMLVLSKKYATEIALTAGLDNCIGDYAILFDLHTDPPNMLSLLINKLLAGFDIVIGKLKKENAEYSLPSKFFLMLIGKISTHGFYYRQNYLTALNRKAINSIIRTRRKSRNFGYMHELIGFKKCMVEYDMLKKVDRRVKAENFFELFFTVIDIVISNSFRPIRILSLLGMFFSFLFLLYVFAIIILFIFFGVRIAPQGWISVSTVIGTLFFLLFSLLALIAEYIVRIVNESRNEPLYFVADELDKSAILQNKDMLNVGKAL